MTIYCYLLTCYFIFLASKMEYPQSADFKCVHAYSQIVGLATFILAPALAPITMHSLVA